MPDLHFFAAELGRLKEEGLTRRVDLFQEGGGKRIRFGDKNFFNLASNNYLGLSGHPRLVAAAGKAMREWGTGATGSRLLGGNLPPHRELEQKLLGYRNLGGSLFLNSGYAANTGLLQALASRFSLTLSDKKNHASIHDGLSLLGKPFARFAHGSLAHLERFLSAAAAKAGVAPGSPGGLDVFVISETLFSMDGDFAPLPELLRLQERFGFFLALDEAHSTGCVPGLVEEAIRRAPERVLVMGTFGKAFGSAGAYLCAHPVLIDYLVQTCRPFIFSTALPPAVAAANIAALEVAEEESWRAEKLADLARFAHRAMDERSLSYGASRSHILPLLAGSNEAALALSRALAEQGFHAPAVRHPTVPKGQARLRCNLTAEMEKNEVEAFLEAAARAFRELGLRRPGLPGAGLPGAGRDSAAAAAMAGAD